MNVLVIDPKQGRFAEGPMGDPAKSVGDTHVKDVERDLAEINSDDLENAGRLQ
jgi:hypothetical protein